MNSNDEDESRRVIEWVSSKLLHSFGDDDPADETLSVVKQPSSQSAAIENKRFDSSLAKEFNKLSIQERGKKLEEVHGVAPIPEENPEFLEAKLTELKVVIQEAPNKPRAYFQALEQNEGYVNSPKFGLMFLRAELFRVEKAATRLLFFLKKKLEFFGEDALTRDLRLSDLPEDAQKTLENGPCQLLPFRDRSGRIIFVEAMFTGERRYPHIKDYFLVKCFLCIIAFEHDEDAQRNGCIGILWNMDYLRVDTDVDSRWTKEASDLTHWLPLRINAIHICNDMDPIKQFWARFTVAMTDSELRNNFRIHRGTPTEVLFKLMTYGITAKLLPVDGDGKLTMTNSRWWFQLLQKMDQEHPNGRAIDKILIPTNKDVLFGKGDIIQNHFGNQSLRQLMGQSFSDYQQMKKNEKTLHTRKVIELVEARGGRFLVRDIDGLWEEADEDKARLKVAKAYSDMRCKVQKKGGVKDVYIATSGGEHSSKKRRAELASASILSTANFPNGGIGSCCTPRFN